jgi:hypothetical protein
MSRYDAVFVVIIPNETQMVTASLLLIIIKLAENY